MIGRLHGKLLEKNPPQILIDVSGVGYEVDVPMSTFCNLPEVGGELTLHTHFVVREDAQLLYGFATLAERAVFRALIKISGVGPKIALALLSGITVDQLKDAVDRGETGLLTKVPGIGKKTAERLVLELKVSSQAPAQRQRQRQCRPPAHVPTLRPRSSPWGIPNAKPLPRRRSSPRTAR